MAISVKHLLVRIALTLLRLALKLKLQWMARPFQTVGAFLFRTVFVPAYRLVLLTRRTLDRLYLPAKNRLLFLFSNRLAIHAAIVLVAIWSTLLNASGHGARAEGLGDESVVLILLGGESAGVTEEGAEDMNFVPEFVSYENEAIALSAPLAHDVEYGFIDLTDTTVLTSGVVAPSGAGVEQKKSAPRKRAESETYVVQEGDTIGSIAKQFDLAITTILWANDLSVRSVIRPGDGLTILPVDGVIHKVKNGDTMSRIAALYDVSATDVTAYNGKDDPNDLSIGEVLVIPGGEKQAPTPTRSVASVSSIFAPAPAAGSSAAASALGMIWPSDLHKINLYFGVLYFLGRHTGLDIDCNNTGNSNYAAADGIVSYAGWRRGYGYAVEIDHGNGIMTRYGHNAKLYVSTGDSVAQGAPIALCGSTGNSTGAHLHFEVIVNGKFVNPLGYIQ